MITYNELIAILKGDIIMNNFNVYPTCYVKNKISKIIINEIDQNVENNKTGFIQVSIYDAVTFEPIENAKVEILEMKISGLYHETGFGDMIITERSDSNGQVPLIELMSNYEQEVIPDVGYEHIHYHIKISHEDYCVVYVMNILVYPGITNLYRVNMSPSSMERPRYEFIITPVTPPTPY